MRNSPVPLRRLAARAIWAGAWEHLANFDHRDRFGRGVDGLTTLDTSSGRILSAVPIRSLVGIDRPVTLVTSGPSALEHDWESVRKSGRFMVVVSGGATFVRERGIRPDLIVVSDPRFCPVGGYHIRDAGEVPLAIEYRGALALANAYPGALENRPVSLLERVNKWYGKPRLPLERLLEMNERSNSPLLFSGTDDPARDGWSRDPSLGFFPSSTVAVVALQVLVALGARDIEIIGMDLGGGTSIYGDALPSRLDRDYQKSILPTFLTMREALAGSGVKIRNLSPVCRLPKDIFDYER